MTTPEQRAAWIVANAHGGSIPRRLAPDVVENVEQAITAEIREAESEARADEREKVEAETIRLSSGYRVTVGEFLRRAREIGDPSL